jgi:NADPH-dependent curcumin reductase CurA
LQSRLTVIASAGTDAKVNYLLSLGADVAFNYKTIPVAAALQEHGPIDLFWDNVGGAQLEAALENMNMKGRVIVSLASFHWDGMSYSHGWPAVLRRHR